MALAERTLLTARRELFEGILADRGEHAEAWLAVGPILLPHQALLDERGEPVQDVDAQSAFRVANRPCRLQRAAALQHREPTEEDLLHRRQQVIAPGDRVSKRLLAAGDVARATGEERETLVQPVAERFRREDAQACRGQFQR